jgi:hypothetical protein
VQSGWSACSKLSCYTVEHLGHFPIFTIINNTVLNILMKEIIFAFPLFSEEGALVLVLLGHKGVHKFNTSDTYC